MQPYLNAAQQNERRALALYRWHGDLTAAVVVVLGTAEVVLRNAMDRTLQEWNDGQPGTTGSWLLDEPAAPLRSLSKDKRKNAKVRAEKEISERGEDHHRYQIPLSHDDVLAQTMFGMWKDLLPNHHPNAGTNQANDNRIRLWNEALCQSFPNEKDPDGAVTYWRVARVHRLRNRVSHMEPLLNIDVRAEVDQAFDLVRSIDTTVAAWITGTSRVSAVLGQRPSR